MQIGNVLIDSRLSLALMAGVTDIAFRQICAEMGAGLTCTELVSSKALCYKDKKTFSLLQQFPGEHPAAVQIFGNDPVCMAEAVVKAVGVPVTAKFRRGWGMGSCNCVEFAKTLEAAGVSAVAVHGRTRAQVYGGNADWNCIREVKEAVLVPVIANGDIWEAKDVLRILQHTKVDMAMIGRGCFGNPWIFAQAKALLEGNPLPELPPLAERCDVAVRQFELAAQAKGERVAILEARKHYCWYLKGVSHPGYHNEQIGQMNSLEDVHRVTKGIKRGLA